MLQDGRRSRETLAYHSSCERVRLAMPRYFTAAGHQRLRRSGFIGSYYIYSAASIFFADLDRQSHTIPRATDSHLRCLWLPKIACTPLIAAVSSTLAPRLATFESPFANPDRPSHTVLQLKNYHMRCLVTLQLLVAAMGWTSSGLTSRVIAIHSRTPPHI